MQSVNIIIEDPDYVSIERFHEVYAVTVNQTDEEVYAGIALPDTRPDVRTIEGIYQYNTNKSRKIIFEKALCWPIRPLMEIMDHFCETDELTGFEVLDRGND